MTAPTPLIRPWLGWSLVIGGLVALLGWQMGGRVGEPQREARKMQPPPPVAVTLLPEYGIEGGLGERAQTVGRTLFNPTRRPSPPAEAPKPLVQRPVLVLLGTSISGERRTAFLRDASTSRSRMVAEGDRVEGLTVVGILSDRIRLAADGTAEDLLIKPALPQRESPRAGPGGGPQPGSAAPAGIGAGAPVAAAPPSPPVQARAPAAGPSPAAVPDAPPGGESSSGDEASAFGSVPVPPRPASSPPPPGALPTATPLPQPVPVPAPAPAQGHPGEPASDDEAAQGG